MLFALRVLWVWMSSTVPTLVFPRRRAHPAGSLACPTSPRLWACCQENFDARFERSRTIVCRPSKPVKDAFRLANLAPVLPHKLPRLNSEFNISYMCLPRWVDIFKFNMYTCSCLRAEVLPCASWHRLISAGGFVKSGLIALQNIVERSGLTRRHHIARIPAKWFVLEAKGSSVCLLDSNNFGWPGLYLINQGQNPSTATITNGRSRSRKGPASPSAFGRQAHPPATSTAMGCWIWL